MEYGSFVMREITATLLRTDKPDTPSKDHAVCNLCVNSRLPINSQGCALKDSVGYKKQQKAVMPIWYLFESPVYK